MLAPIFNVPKSLKRGLRANVPPSERRWRISRGQYRSLILTRRPTDQGNDARLVNVIKLRCGGKEVVSGLGMLYSPCELNCGIYYKTQALGSICSMVIALEEAYITIAVNADESKPHTLYTSSPLRPNCRLIWFDSHTDSKGRTLSCLLTIKHIELQ